MALSSGSTLGPYTITSELGHGGMGVVYTAEDPRLKRQVAIKLLPPDLTRDETAKQRFLQEAQAASALDHPNICTIHEINETDDGQLYLVMAHYEGETLQARIARGPLALDDAIDIATQVGQGLAKAHAARIVHRDIKPANLMVTTDGTVKILDFGLAKLAGTEGVTQTGTTVGTVAYMSPEQARGEEVDHRTDIWSLGVVLYEMLSGQPPFQGENLLSLAEAIRSGEPESLTGAAASLAPVLGKALNKDSGQRYQTATDLLGELQSPSASAAVPAVTGAEPDVPSIAVLPFADLSPEKDQEYFCDGLAEELIDALARLDGLRVVARTSAFQFRGRDIDLREVGRTLRVKTVLEGSVRKAGTRLRINAQLINTEDGYHLWSHRFDRRMDDVFEIQDEIARTVVDTLKVRLVNDTDQELVRGGTHNLAAYNLYLKGRFYLAKQTQDGLASSLECFTKAIAEDPGFAPPLAGIALNHAFRSAFSWAAPRDVAAEAKRSALDALALDESDSDAHAAFALSLHFYEWDWRAAESEYRRALELNPSDTLARSLWAFFLSHMGRHEDAVGEARQAVDLDPVSGLAHHFLSLALFFSRRYDLAVEQARRSLELDPAYFPAYWDIAIGSAALGEYDHAISALHEGLTPGPGDPSMKATLAWAYALAGRREEAIEIFEQLKEWRRKRYFSAVWMGWICEALGDPSEAIAWLERAHEERDVTMSSINAMPAPFFVDLRTHPRFQDLRRRMNFPSASKTGAVQ